MSLFQETFSLFQQRATEEELFKSSNKIEHCLNLNSRIKQEKFDIILFLQNNSGLV